MKQTVLVLAAHGNVGVPLVEAMLRAGAGVRAASLHGGVVGPAPGVIFDFGDPATYAAAFEGVDSVYLMLPRGLPEPQDALLSVIRYAAPRKIKVVMQTVIEADFDPHSLYLPVEQALRESGTRHVILRPTWFMDNLHLFWADDIRRGELAIAGGTGKVAFIDVRDVAASAAAALLDDRFDGQTLSLTGPEALSYADVAAILSSVLGRPIRYLPLSAENYRERLIAAGMPAQAATFFVSALAMVGDGAASTVHPSVAQLTGRPAHTLAQYAQDQAARFRS